MYKMTIIFRKPEDTDQFEDQWATQFLPIAEQMPGIKRIAVCPVDGEPSGVSDFYKLHEFYFEKREDLERALTSEKGERAGRALMNFGHKISTILFSEVFEEERKPGLTEKSPTTNVGEAGQTS